jgi:hypothetical protein
MPSKRVRNSSAIRLFSLVVFVLQAFPSRAQLSDPPTTAEREILSKLDADRTGKEIQRLSVGVVDNDSGAGAGTAIAGSADEKNIADAVAEEMKTIGLDVHTEPFPVRHYEYGKVSLKVNGMSIEAISPHTGGGTWGTIDGVPYTRGNAESGHLLRATLVDVGRGASADYAKVGDVQGKAVIAHGFGINSQILEASYRGAAALVVFENREDPEGALAQGGDGNCNRLPTVEISKKSGIELQKRMQNGAVNIELENRIDSSDGTSYNVIGTLKGTEFPDEWIMVSAHYDRWWHSANDNEAGVASVLEIARAFSGSYKPKRNIMFITPGAEEGGMVDSQREWLAGSWAFIQAHPEVMRRLVYDRNFDLSGWTATKGTMLTSPEIAQAQKSVIADLGLSDRITVTEGQDTGTDAWNFGAVGGGSTSLLIWNSRMSWAGPEWDPKAEPDPFWKYSHTQFDLYRPEDYKNLLTELKVSTLSVLRMDETLNVPIRFTDVASWAEKALDSDATKATGVSFDDARAALNQFRSEAERVESIQKDATSAEQARVINDVLLNTRRNLMPWLYSDAEGSFRTTRDADTLAAIEKARTAAEKNDRAGTLKPLEDIDELRRFAGLSPEVEQQERLSSEASNDWGLVYQQLAQAPAPELVAVFRDLDKGGDVSAKVESLRRLEARGKADLSHSLWIVAGHLRKATETLRTARLD